MLPYLIFLEGCVVLFIGIFREFLRFVGRAMEGRVQEKEIEGSRSCLCLWSLLIRVREFLNNFEELFELLFYVDFLKFEYRCECLKVIKNQN